MSVRVILLRLSSARQGAVITVTIECHCALGFGNEVSEVSSCLERGEAGPSQEAGLCATSYNTICCPHSGGMSASWREGLLQGVVMTLACSGCMEVGASEPSMDACTPLLLFGWLMGHVPLWTLCPDCDTHGIWLAWWRCRENN